jgi:hypothetical protein
MKRFIIFLIFIASASQKTWAEMDWSRLMIKSSDTDQANLASRLKNELYELTYDENQTVADFLKFSFDRETKLDALVSEYSIVEQHYLTDGSMEYQYQLPLTNKIMALLLPETKPVKLVVPMLCPCCGQDWPSGRPVPEGVELMPKQIESVEYTGIIIDCRGFNLVPCLFPKIYNDMQQEIYSVNFADLHQIVESGLVQYSTQDLYNNPRTGYNPLRIRAVGIAGTKMTNIRISSFDARRIHGSRKNLQLLKECRVAIIFGR